MSTINAFETLLEQFRQQRPMRAGSLIITLFGDSISLRGNNVWLGGVIAALEPFGLNPRLVRTSVYRLIQDGWLNSTQLGRRSYYSFSDYGMRQYENAALRIYAAERPHWDGVWTLVLLNNVADNKDLLRKELSWMGFGSLLNGMMAHPGAFDRRKLEATLQEMQIADQVAILESTTINESSATQMREMVFQSWDIEALGQNYEQFLDNFRPILKEVQAAKQLDDESCFQIRTFLVHEYRRILLHDSDLPDELLPTNWPGTSAYHLTANLYRLVAAQAEKFISEHFVTPDGSLPAAKKTYQQRFGGLQQKR
jgi:phenylacetic acid degradation operon negative regulatory protein